jgi:hypothetical protein
LGKISLLSFLGLRTQRFCTSSFYGLEAGGHENRVLRKPVLDSFLKWNRCFIYDEYGFTAKLCILRKINSSTFDSG